MSINKETDEEILFLTTKFYFDNQKSIHVTYSDGTWNNGDIVEVKQDFFMLNDFEDGIMPIFFIKVKSIKEFKKEVK